jgi:predicted nucleotidyltransferase
MTLLEVIQRISPGLENESAINAMWLEGSWATSKNNEHSDIDVWLDVKDGTFEACIDAFRSLLSKNWTIDWEKSRGIYSKAPKLQKHTFHLKGLPEEQRIELDLQENSRKFKFDKNEHIIKVLFDKNNTIQWID